MAISVGRSQRNGAWAEQLGTNEVPALAFLELSSIARGLYLTDLIIKKAPIKVIAAQPVSSGKFVILYFGDVASVDEAHREALANTQDTLIQQVLIPAIHEKLVPYLDSLWEMDAMISSVRDSVGFVESTSLAGAIIAADRALKTAGVALCRLRLGQGIGGKAYFVISGKQEEVEASLEAAQNMLKDLNSLCRTDFVPRPADESLEFF